LRYELSGWGVPFHYGDLVRVFQQSWGRSARVPGGPMPAAAVNRLLAM
jgi:hypothetical protein